MSTLAPPPPTSEPIIHPPAWDDLNQAMEGLSDEDKSHAVEAWKESVATYGRNKTAEWSYKDEEALDQFITGKQQEIEQAVTFTPEDKPYKHLANKVIFSPTHPGEGLYRAWQDGVIERPPNEIFQGAYATQDQILEQKRQKELAGDYTGLKAVGVGAGRGAAFALGGVGTAAGLTPVNTAIAGLGPAGPLLAVGANLIEGMVGGTIAAAGYDELVKSNFEGAVAASQLHPNLTAAGELLSFAVPGGAGLAKGIKRFQLVAENLGKQEAMKQAAKYVAVTGGIGAASTPVMAALDRWKDSALGVSQDNKQDLFDPKSIAANTVLAIMLGNLGVKFTKFSAGEAAGIYQRGMRGEPLNPAEAEMFRTINKKLSENPDSFVFEAEQGTMGGRPIGASAARTQTNPVPPQGTGSVPPPRSGTPPPRPSGSQQRPPPPRGSGSPPPRSTEGGAAPSRPTRFNSQAEFDAYMNNANAKGDAEAGAYAWSTANAQGEKRWFPSWMRNNSGNQDATFFANSVVSGRKNDAHATFTKQQKNAKQSQTPPQNDNGIPRSEQSRPGRVPDPTESRPANPKAEPPLTPEQEAAVAMGATGNQIRTAGAAELAPVRPAPPEGSGLPMPLPKESEVVASEQAAPEPAPRQQELAAKVATATGEQGKELETVGREIADTMTYEDVSVLEAMRYANDQGFKAALETGDTAAAERNTFEIQTINHALEFYKEKSVPVTPEAKISPETQPSPVTAPATGTKPEAAAGETVPAAPQPEPVPDAGKPADPITEPTNAQTPATETTGSRDTAPATPPEPRATEQGRTAPAAEADQGAVAGAAKEIKKEMSPKSDNRRQPKEIKAELIQRLQQAIDEAPEITTEQREAISGGYTHLEERNAQARADIQGKKTGLSKIQVKIPGDGTFKVWNSKEILTDLLRRVNGMKVGTSDKVETRTGSRGVGQTDTEQLAARAGELGTPNEAIAWLRENSQNATPSEKKINEAAIEILERQRKQGSQPPEQGDALKQKIESGRMKRYPHTGEEAFVNGEIFKEMVDFGKGILKAGMDFARWAAEMIKRLGQKAASVLHSVWMSISGQNIPPHLRESGAVFGAGRRRRGNLPDALPQEERFLSGKAFYEGSADVFLQKPQFVPLGKALNKQIDLSEKYLGNTGGKIEAWESRTGKTEQAVAKQEFEQYMIARESGNTAAAAVLRASATPETLDLIKTIEDIAEYTGKVSSTLVQPSGRIGVEVQSDAGIRPLRNMGKEYFPRILKEDIQAALRDPSSNPVLWDSIVDDLLMNGNIATRAEAEAYVKGGGDNDAQSDFLGSLYMARGEKLPDKWYDRSYEAFGNWAVKWSDIVSKIEAFGQKIRPNDKDMFGEALAKTTHAPTQSFIESVSDRAYNERNVGPASKYLLDAPRLLASGLFLSNPVTIGINALSSKVMNTFTYGLRANFARNPFEVFSTKNHLDAYQLGVLKRDMVRLLYRDDMPGLDHLKDFVNGAMNLSGYTAVENLTRVDSLLTAQFFLHDGLAAVRKKPTSLGAINFIGFLKRNGYDTNAIIKENGTGEATDTFLRGTIRDTQGGYAYNQVPWWTDTPMGKFVLQFSKFSTMHTRNVVKNVLRPAFTLEKVKIRVDGKIVTKRVWNIKPLIYFLTGAALGGEAISFLKDKLFGIERKDATMDEIMYHADKSTRDGLALLVMRALNDTLTMGMLGVIGTPIQTMKDVTERSKFRDPLSPPGVSLFKNVGNLIQSAYEQKELRSEDFTDFLKSSVAMYRYGDAFVKEQANNLELEWDAAKLQKAKTDSAFISSLSKRYATEVGLPVKKQTSSGRFGKSETTPIRQELKAALMIGDEEVAKQQVENYLAQFPSIKEKAEKLNSLRDSVDESQPVKVGGISGNQRRIAFLEWAKEKVSKVDMERINAVDQTYRETAIKIGLLNDLNPREKRMLEIKAIRLKAAKSTTATPDEVERFLDRELTNRPSR